MLLRTHPPVFGRRLHDAGSHLRSSDVVPDVVGADRLADGVADTREPDSLADHLANHLEPDAVAFLDSHIGCANPVADSIAYYVCAHGSSIWITDDVSSHGSANADPDIFAAHSSSHVVSIERKADHVALGISNSLIANCRAFSVAILLESDWVTECIADRVFAVDKPNILPIHVPHDISDHGAVPARLQRWQPRLRQHRLRDLRADVQW